MAWTNISPTVTPPSWNVTDIELLKRLFYMLLENGASDADGVTLATTMFSVTQMVNALNDAQQQFFKDTAPIQIRAQQGTTPSQPRYALPNNWIHTRRLSWQAQASGSKSKALTRVDAFQLDHGLLDWQQNTSDTPLYYNDGSNLPNLTVEVIKAPSQVGTATLGYVAQPVTLNGVVASPVNLTVPDEMESAVLYKALELLLSQEGEANDPERAQYCAMRYSLTVDLARKLMEGSM